MAVSLIFGLGLLATAICTAHTTENHGTDVESHAELSSDIQVVVKFICPTLYGRYAHPTSCEYYLECRLGYPRLMKCHQGFLYDEQAKQCRDRRTVTCNKGNKDKENQKEVIPFRCPTPTGRFAHPYDCSKYFECSNNNPSLYECYPNDLYDANIGKCIHRDKVNCGSRFNKYGGRNQDIGFFRCPSSSGIFAHPHDCSLYFECNNNVPSLFYCYPNDLFDVNVKHCIRSDKVNCGKRYNKYDDRNENVRLFKCPVPKGRFAHPYDCSKYIECNNNVPEQYFCYPNDLFDANIGKCVPGRNVNCGNRFNKYALKASVLYSSSAQAEESNEEVIQDTEISTKLQSGYTFTCPTLYGRFPHPYYCDLFFECRLGYSTRMKCHQGYLYDERAKQCRDSRTVVCNKGNKDGGQKPVTPFRCPTPSGRFAHPQDCSQYIECINNNPVLYQCNANNLYDINSGRCIYRDQVNCGSRFNKYGDGVDNNRRFQCPNATGRFPHPYDCSKYIECYKNVPDMFQCYPNDLFDATIGECTREKVDCGNRFNKYALKATVLHSSPSKAIESNETEVTQDTVLSSNHQITNKFSCPTYYGRYAHPETCEYFFECRNGWSMLMHCNRGFLYDEKRKQCIDRRHVVCNRKHINNKDTSKDVAPKFRCPYIWGMYGHASDCSLFYDCRNNVPYLFQCAANFLFETRIGKCLPHFKVTCGTRRNKYVVPDNKDKNNKDNNNNNNNNNNKPFNCPSVSGVFADPSDCSRYFECFHNVPVLFKCEANGLFDPRLGKCVYRTQVNCGNRFNIYDDRKENILHFRCPTPSARYPHPYDCSKFIQCQNSVPTLYYCYANYLYDIKSGQCVIRNQVACGNRFNKYGGQVEDLRFFRCPVATGTYYHPYDCSRYIECHNGVPFSLRCSPNDLYDAKKGICMHKSQVSCGNRFNIYDDGIENIRKFRCPAPNGRFPHPYDCSKYIECHKNIPVLFKCYANDLYAISLQKCIYKDKVNCGDRYNKYGLKDISTPKPPTTPDTTTVTPTTTEITTTEENRQSFYCPFPYGRFADPEDCSQFYECRASVPNLYKCSKYTLYDERKQECIDEEKVRCRNRPGDDPIPEEKDIDIMCPYAWGTFMHPYDCSKYIVCVYNVPFGFHCKKDQLFDAYHRRCLPKGKVQCEDRYNPDGLEPGTSTVEPTITITAPSTSPSPLEPTTTESYDNKKPNTPPPTDCDENDLDCIIDVTGDVVKWFNCRKRYGHYPHGSSKQLFIHCDNWVPFVKKCAHNTIYSPQLQVCVWGKQSV